MKIDSSGHSLISILAALLLALALISRRILNIFSFIFIFTLPSPRYRARLANIYSHSALALSRVGVLGEGEAREMLVN